MSATWRAHLALLFVNTLYAAGHIIAKGVMPAFLSPTTFIFFRIAGATILFWIIKLLFLPKEPLQKKDIGLFLLCSLFGVTINQLFLFHGLNLSSSINSGIIMTTNPILVAIIAYFLFKEKKFSTSAIVKITFSIKKWKKLNESSGKLVFFKRPIDLI